MQVDQELKQLAAIYAVYAEHVDAVRQYGSQLWSELDVSKMVTGELAGQQPQLC
jgi:hypothetical protein